MTKFWKIPEVEGGVIFWSRKTHRMKMVTPGERQPLLGGDSDAWAPLTYNNPGPKGNLIILVGNNPIWVAEGGDLRVGDVINVFFDGLERPDVAQQGQFEVVSCKTDARYHDEPCIHIEVRFVAPDFDATKLVHLASLARR